MADKRVQVGLQADATQAVKSINDVASALTPVLNKLHNLETTLANIATGDASKMQARMAALKSYIGDLSKLVSSLSNINPQVALRNAGMRGEMASMRSDVAVQALQYEREINKVLAAREKIYRDLRQANPNAGKGAMLGMYRDTLSGMGEATPHGWKARTEREVLEFERRIAQEGLKIQEAADRQSHRERMRLLDVERREFEKAEKWKAGVRYRSMLQEQRDQEKLDRERERELRRMQRERERQAARDYRWSSAGVEERTGQAFMMQGARQRYMGGAPLMAQRMDFLRDYMLMGASLGGATLAIRSVIDLQTALKTTQAISKATNLEMESLTKTVFKVGQTTKFAVREIAEAATVMAQAGYSAQQIEQSLPAIAQLAVGAGASIQDSVNIVTSVLTIYDMSIERTAKVSNMLAEALNGSKLSLQQLSLGVQYAGNIAADSGVQFDELTAALGAMSNAGIKSGSTLGTGLRALIQELENPSVKFRDILRSLGLTVEDVDIKSQGLGGALMNLSRAGFTSGQAMQVFELRAAAAYSAIENNLDSYETQLDALQHTSAAAEASAVQMSGFAAQMGRAGNAIVQFLSGAGAPLLGALTELARGFADLISSIDGTNPVVQTLVVLLTSLLALNTLKWLGSMAAGFVLMQKEAKAATASVGLLNVAMRGLTVQSAITAGVEALAVGLRGITTAAIALGRALLTTPLGWFALALTGVVMLIGAHESKLARLNKEIEKYKTAANEAAGKAAMYGDRISEINNYIDKLINRYDRLKNSNQEFRSELDRGVASFAAWSDQINNSVTNVDELIRRMIVLKKEMHELQLAQLEMQKANLRGEQIALRTKNAELRKDTRNELLGFTTLVRSTPRVYGRKATQDALSDPSIAQLISRFTKDSSSLTPQELERLAGKLSAALPKLGSDYDRQRVQKIIEMLSNPSFMEEWSIGKQIDALERPISTASVLASPQAATASRAIATSASSLTSQYASTAGIKDPVAQARARASIRTEAIKAMKGLNEILTGQATILYDDDPEMTRGFRLAAERYIGPFAGGDKSKWEASVRAKAIELIRDALARDNTDIANVAVLAGDPTAETNIGVLQARQRDVEAQLKVAKQDRDKALIESLIAEQEALKKRIYALQNPDADPLNALAVFGYTEGGSASSNEYEQENQDRITARIKAAELKRRMAAQEKQIAATAVQTNPLAGGAPLTLEEAKAQLEALFPGVVITSGQRTAERNAQVGGAANSWHLGGKAFDIAPIQDMTFKEFEEKLRASGLPIAELLDETSRPGHGAHWHWAWGNELAGGSPINQDALKAQLDMWKATGIEQLRAEAKAGGLKDDELQDRLKDFEVFANEYISKVLSGNLADAKEMLAARAAQAADARANLLVAELGAKGGDLDQAIKDISAVNAEALKLALDAAEQKFRTDNPLVTDLTNANEWQKKVAEITREWSDKTLKNAMDAIEAFYAYTLAKQEAAFEAQTAERGREQSKIAALSNPWGMRHLSDVQRKLGSLKAERLQADQLRQNVLQAQARVSTNKQLVSRWEGALADAVARGDQSQIDDLTRKLAEAKEEGRALAVALTEAESALAEATDHAPEFTSALEALRGAWEAFSSDGTMGKSVYESMADGFYNTFETARTGLKGLVKDVMSGTKTMEEAFRDFAMSVLDSMLEMAAEIAANQIMQWIMGKIMSVVLPGSSAGTGHSMIASGAANGGLPAGRFAPGGLITGRIPNRDSVPILAMPGEVMMNRSAVEMVGADNLLALNAMGNRRLGEIKSMPAPPPREPDMVNVYVVAPDQKPPPSKKDIIAFISDDIQTNGVTKKLIKAVAMGA